MDSFEAVVTPFLKKLLILVNDTPKEVGEWDEEGKVFIVKISSRFEESLRRYFKGTLQTFIRQLHFYGFSKMDMPRNHTNSWSFSHPYFLRDQPALITNIKRKVSSQNHNNSSTESSETPTPLTNKKKCSNGCSCSSANESLLRRKDQEIEDLRRQVASLTDTVNELANFVGYKRPITNANLNTHPGVYGQYAVQGMPTVEKLSKKRMRSEQLASTVVNAAAAANSFHQSTFQSSPLDNNLALRGEINEKRHKAAAEEMFSNFLEFSGLPLMDIGRSMNERKRNDDENTVASVATEDLMSDFVREFESPANLSYSLLDKQAKFAKADNTKYPSLEQVSSSQKSEEVTV